MFSVAQQAELLSISRSSLYYTPRENAEDKKIVTMIDAIYTELPFYGSRRMKNELFDRHRISIGREHIQRLMRQMGIEAIYPKRAPNTSAENAQHLKYPYLLAGITAEYPNHIWGSDITYIKTEKGWAYLVALIDWYSRYVVAWELSPTLEIEFCLENVASALKRATPEIHNSDQGSHFTSPRYTNILSAAGVTISMDGRGRCMDNIFTERFWRTVKYEEVYLKSYHDIMEARVGLSKYIPFYNERRRHQSLEYRTPEELYRRTKSVRPRNTMKHESLSVKMRPLTYPQKAV